MLSIRWTHDVIWSLAECRKGAELCLSPSCPESITQETHRAARKEREVVMLCTKMGDKAAGERRKSCRLARLLCLWASSSLEMIGRDQLQPGTGEGTAGGGHMPDVYWSKERHTDQN